MPSRKKLLCARSSLMESGGGAEQAWLIQSLARPLFGQNQHRRIAIFHAGITPQSCERGGTAARSNLIIQERVNSAVNRLHDAGIR